MEFRGMDGYRLLKLHSSFQFLTVVLIAAVILSFPLPTQAQSTLQLYTPVFGEISGGQPQNWTFPAAEGEVLSFLVESASDDFDPVLTILDSSGAALIANDDYNYPDSGDALLEAITIPQFGAYTVSVSGFDGSSGEYTLTMFGGYSDLFESESFDDDNWQATAPLQASVEDGQLVLQLPDRDQSGVAANNNAAAVENFYAQVTVLTIDAPNGWTAGMTIRQQSDGAYYLFSVNHQGQWSFIANTTQGQRVLRDRVISPAIPANETTFRLGVLANGPAFDLFYNGQYIGQVIDASISGEGRIGLMTASVGAFGSQTTAYFDDLNITTPRRIGQSAVLPQQLTAQTPTDTVRELQRRQLIPPEGEMALTIPESFATYANPGVQPYLLSGGTQFIEFVMGATLSWEIEGDEPAGCGLLVKALDDSQYTLAYLDQTGAYGLSERAGGAFERGLFGEGLEITGADAHRLIVIANADTLYYYIDNQLVGTQTSPEVAGEIGNAVVNFETVSTACQFTDTWVWAWG
jgi:hypothetical protein